MMAQVSMSSRFKSYLRTRQKVRVKDLVLFGDRTDVKLENAKIIEPTKSEVCGTTIYKKHPCTRAYPGIFYHSIVQLSVESYYTPWNAVWFHLIHHEKVNGEAVGKYLCDVSGHSDWREDNVWNRYDWCENMFRNEYDDKMGNEDQYKILFVAVKRSGKFRKKTTEIGRITMDLDCIDGDWNYGLRLVDPNTKQAYAYVFGDALVYDELTEDGDWPKSDFNVPMANFYT